MEIVRRYFANLAVITFLLFTVMYWPSSFVWKRYATSDPPSLPPYTLSDASANNLQTNKCSCTLVPLRLPVNHTNRVRTYEADEATQTLNFVAGGRKGAWNLQNTKDKEADQPTKKRATPCRTNVLPLLNHRG
jgi:hypothetical protein